MTRKFLVALDSSERAQPVFHAAVDLAEAIGASLHLLRVVAVPPEFPPAGHVPYVDKLPAVLVKQATEQLAAFAAMAPRLRVEQIVRDSVQPWRSILEVADEIDADLIVLGSHGYNGIDYLLGTNAGKVANLATRNVLVVHRAPESSQTGSYRRTNGSRTMRARPAPRSPRSGG
jgi:nucleotide-binding universal stress UspA family protein